MAKIKETKTVFTDYETGEIKQETVFTETKKNKTLVEPEHIKIYMQDLCKIKGLKDADYRTLLRLIEDVDKKLRLRLTERARDEICADLKINRDTLRKRLPRLTKANLLKMYGRNDYMINPNYFSLGSMNWKEVCESNVVFKMEISYKGNKKRDSCKKKVRIKEIPDLKIVK